MKRSIIQPMQVWAQWPDGVKVVTTVESGPDALAWLTDAQAQGAVKVGYTPCDKKAVSRRWYECPHGREWSRCREAPCWKEDENADWEDEHRYDHDEFDPPEPDDA